MVASLKKIREIVLQITYSRDLNDTLSFKEFACMLDQLIVSRKVLYQACAKVEKLFTEINTIDLLITQFSKGYDFKRISRVERNILRLGVFEIIFEKKAPPKVSISEAVRLSQKFGTPEGGAFVNGVLDAIFQSQDHVCCPKVASNLLNH